MSDAEFRCRCGRHMPPKGDLTFGVLGTYECPLYPDDPDQHDAYEVSFDPSPISPLGADHRADHERDYAASSEYRAAFDRYNDAVPSPGVSLGTFTSDELGEMRDRKGAG